MFGACDQGDGVVDSTPATAGPAGNGLIAYTHDGDIYVGDPVTGATTRIVAGPESDINPIFSPDGSRIAFVRGTPVLGPASLLAVRVDGSDERLVVPETPGSSSLVPLGVGPFAWTPDGTSIVVQTRRLALFDASGKTEPQPLVPPLDANIGAIYFNPSAQVAPMFRPPDGDLILGCCRDALEVYDADLRLLRQLDFGPLARYDIFADDPTWSPDGTRILVEVSLFDPSEGGSAGVPDPSDEYVGSEMIVMDADGGDFRRLGPGGFSPMWSPDGLSIAYEDWDFENQPDEARIAVLDLATGTRQVLESSVSPLKHGAAVQTITNNVEHDWYYEGWSWSPDGRSLLLLKDHLTRPVLIDVATDTATKLPWETDSFPSWQQVVAP